LLDNQNSGFFLDNLSYISGQIFYVVKFEKMFSYDCWEGVLVGSDGGLTSGFVSRIHLEIFQLMQVIPKNVRMFISDLVFSSLSELEKTKVVDYYVGNIAYVQRIKSLPIILQELVATAIKNQLVDGGIVCIDLMAIFNDQDDGSSPHLKSFSTNSSISDSHTKVTNLIDNKNCDKISTDGLYTPTQKTFVSPFPTLEKMLSLNNPQRQKSQVNHEAIYTTLISNDDDDSSTQISNDDNDSSIKEKELTTQEIIELRTDRKFTKNIFDARFGIATVCDSDSVLSDLSDENHLNEINLEFDSECSVTDTEHLTVNPVVTNLSINLWGYVSWLSGKKKRNLFLNDTRYEKLANDHKTCILLGSDQRCCVNIESRNVRKVHCFLQVLEDEYGNLVLYLTENLGGTIYIYRDGVLHYGVNKISNHEKRIAIENGDIFSFNKRLCDMDSEELMRSQCVFNMNGPHRQIPHRAFEPILSESLLNDFKFVEPVEKLTDPNYPYHCGIIQGLVDVTVEFLDVVELNKQMLFNKILDFLNNYTVLHSGGKIEHEDWLGFFNDIYNHSLQLKYEKTIYMKNGVSKIGFNMLTDYDNLSDNELILFKGYSLTIENKIKKQMIEVMHILNCAVSDYLQISPVSTDTFFSEDYSSFYTPFIKFANTGLGISENKENNLRKLLVATTKNAILTRKIRNTQYNGALLKVI
jgi:hypothetical protein